MDRPSLVTQVTRTLPTVGPLRRYLTRKVEPLTDIYLVLPLFALYQLGILTQFHRAPGGGFAWVGNGADFLTRSALALAHGSLVLYGLGTAVVSVALGVMIRVARRQYRLNAWLFLPMLAESAAYAVLTAGLIGTVVSQLGLGVLDTEGLWAQVVASAGAGLHEELVFRVALFGGLTYLLGPRLPRGLGFLLALVGSSALFSGVHYLGPLGDTFAWDTYAFRFFCGVVFALIFRWRGFAIAAWTHCLYDILYFVLRHA